MQSSKPEVSYTSYVSALSTGLVEIILNGTVFVSLNSSPSQVIYVRRVLFIFVLVRTQETMVLSAYLYHNVNCLI